MTKPSKKAPNLALSLAMLCALLACAVPSAVAAPAQSSEASLDPDLVHKIPVRFEQQPGSGLVEQWAGRGVGFAVGISGDGAMFRAGSRMFQMRFAGSDPAASFTGEEISATPTHYFGSLGPVGANGSSSVGEPTVREAYLKLRRNQVYPGIDLVYYGFGQGIEYDFELATGADPSQIRIHFDGVDQVRLSGEGDLLLMLDGQVVKHQAPVVYQEVAPGHIAAVKSHYFPEAGGAYSIRLGDYDISKPVVIDPEVLFTAYLAGGGTDTVEEIAFDANETLYLTGTTFSTDFPLVGEAFSPVVDTVSEHIFTTKMNPLSSGDDVITYSGIFGDRFGDTVTAMDVDANGFFYLTGVTNNASFPITEGAFRDQNESARRMFFSVLDSNLPGKSSLVYSTYFAGIFEGFDDPETEDFDDRQRVAVPDEPAGIAAHDGLVYITGITHTDDFPTKNAFQDSRAGNYDVFLSVFNPALGGDDSLLISTYFGGVGNDIASAIEVDEAGNIYIAGHTFSGDYPTTVGSYKPFYSGAGDAFLTKFNPDVQQLLYSTMLGTSSIEQAYAMHLNSAGQVALAGVTLGADFPMTQDASQPVYAGQGDVFLAVLDPNEPEFPNQLIYSTYYGGTDGDVPYDLARGEDGKFYLSGYTLSRDLPVKDALKSMSRGNSTDGFVAIIDPNRGPFDQLIYSSYVTGGASQIASNIAVDSQNNVYVAGYGIGNVFSDFQASPPPDSNLNVFLFVFRPSEASAPAQHPAESMRSMRVRRR